MKLKLISFALLIVMLFSTVAFAAQQTDIKSLYDEQRYNRSIELLQTLKIAEKYTSTDFMPEKTLNKAEFAEICSILSLKYGDTDVLKDISMDYELFLDVDKNHWAAEYIYLLKRNGVVSGGTDSKFYPNKEITGIECLKMIICVLGYKSEAEAKGGYPFGYWNTAISLGLIKGINSDMNSTINRGQIAVLLYNALNTDIRDVTSIGTDIKETVVKGKTILTKNFELTRYQGTVIANENITLAGSYNCKKDEVLIDGIIYKKGVTNIDDYVGQYVDIYYNYDESKDEKVIKVIIVSDKNRIIRVEDKDIKSETNLSKIVFDKDGIEQTYTLSENVLLAYNNQPMLPLEENKLKNINGYLDLYDNNNDGEIDIVVVYDYTVKVVQSIGVRTKTISIKADVSETINIDEDVGNKKVILKLNGKNADISDVNKDDILSIMNSTDINGKQFITIDVTRKTIDGIVSEIDESTLKLKIADKEYNFVSSILSNIKVNSSYVFSFDVMGRIVYIEDSKVDPSGVGYLVKLAKSQGVNTNLQFKIFTNAGKMAFYDGVDKIIVGDGQSIDKLKKTSDQIIVIFNKTPQLINYRLNSEGKIREIDFAYNRISLNQKSYFSKDFYSTSSEYEFAGRIADKFVITSNTKVFFAPTDTTKDKEFKVGTMKDLVRYTNYDMTVYNVDDQYITDTVVIKTGSSLAGEAPNVKETVLSIITKISKVIDDEENNCLKLETYKGGVKQPDIIVKDMNLIALSDYTNNYGYGGLSVSSLKIGDIVQLSVRNNELRGFRVIFRPLADLPTSYKAITTVSKTPGATDTDDLYIGYGKVTKKTDTILLFNASQSQDISLDRTMFLDNPVSVYIISSKYNDSIITTGSLEDINVGDKVIVRINYKRINDIFVID